MINLKKEYGKKHIVRLEEPARTFADPAYHIIPCRHGHIYPHGGRLLAFSSKKAGKKAREVAKLPSATVEQEGSDGWNISFSKCDFIEVAKIVKPYRRPRLTNEQLRARAELARKNFGGKNERLRKDS